MREGPCPRVPPDRTWSSLDLADRASSGAREPPPRLPATRKELRHQYPMGAARLTPMPAMRCAITNKAMTSRDMRSPHGRAPDMYIEGER